MIELTDRFWKKVDKSPGLGPTGECWEWGGARRSRGYGHVNFNRKYMAAHRAVWVATHGPLPSSIFVCHRCDNPPCVRLDHLFVGTQADNMRDASEKGRIRVVKPAPKQACPQGHPYVDGNVYVRASGQRRCKICDAEQKQRYRERRLAQAYVKAPLKVEIAEGRLLISIGIETMAACSSTIVDVNAFADRVSRALQRRDAVLGLTSVQALLNRAFREALGEEGEG